jgi:DNA-directed RNA polymerase specialized sigma24 family protein
MADNQETNASPWLAVIGKALAYLCLSRAIEREPNKYRELLDKVRFLEGLGLSAKDAAEALGSSSGSVRVMRHMRKKAKKDGKAKKKTRTT